MPVTKERSIILLIDDNIELAEFISIHLSDYQVVLSSNTIDGFDKAAALLPALIICDESVIEPAQFTCYEQLQSDERTKHIPIILLTIKRFNGAPTTLSDSHSYFLVKPFLIQELQVMMDRLLNKGQKGILADKILAVEENVQVKKYSQRQLHHPLLKAIYTILEKKLDDSSFNVEALADQLSMSKASLHRKLKELTGVSPGNIIHEYKLEKAVQFLKDGYTSAQTAYKTGFDSPAYFSKCFREYYGVAPLKYVQQYIIKY